MEIKLPQEAVVQQQWWIQPECAHLETDSFYLHLEGVGFMFLQVGYSDLLKYSFFNVECFQ